MTQEQILAALVVYHVSRPAPRIDRSRFRATIYEGEVEGRTLKVYVREDTEPPLVTTVAWKD